MQVADFLESSDIPVWAAAFCARLYREHPDHFTASALLQQEPPAIQHAVLAWHPLLARPTPLPLVQRLPQLPAWLHSHALRSELVHQAGDTAAALWAAAIESHNGPLPAAAAERVIAGLRSEVQGRAVLFLPAEALAQSGCAEHWRRPPCDVEHLPAMLQRGTQVQALHVWCPAERAVERPRSPARRRAVTPRSDARQQTAVASEVMHRVLHALRGHALRSLCVSCGPRALSADALRALPQLAGLRCLRLCHLDLSAAEAHTLGQALHAMPALRRASFAECVFRCCDGLTEWLQQSPCLAHFEMVRCDLRWHRHQSLAATGQIIDWPPDCWPALQRSISRLSQLESLHIVQLECVGGGRAFATAFAGACGRSARLRDAVFEHRANDSASVEIWTAFMRALAGHASLRSVVLTTPSAAAFQDWQPRGLAGWLHHKTALEHLCGLPELMRQPPACVAACAPLRTLALTLCSNEHDDAPVVLPPSLTSLELHLPQDPDRAGEAARRVTAALRGCTALRRLHLTGATNATKTALASAAMAPPEMRAQQLHLA